MSSFKVNGQIIQAPSFDAAYALAHGVSIAEAIADRDDPCTREELVTRFIAAAGRGPTEGEMDTMKPNSYGDCLSEDVRRQS